MAQYFTCESIPHQPNDFNGKSPKNLLYYLEVPKITDKMECKFSCLAFVGEVLKGLLNSRGGAVF